VLFPIDKTTRRAGPVLTATGFVYGKWKILTRYPLTHRQKLSQVIISVTFIYLCQIWFQSIHGICCTSRWNMTIFYLFIKKTRLYMSDMLTDCRAWWLKRRGLTQDVPFGSRWHCAHLGGQIFHKLPIIRAWIGIVKANAESIPKVLHGFKSNFAKWLRPPMAPNTLRGLSKNM